MNFGIGIKNAFGKKYIIFELAQFSCFVVVFFEFRICNGENLNEVLVNSSGILLAIVLKFFVGKSLKYEQI